MARLSWVRACKIRIIELYNLHLCGMTAAVVVSDWFRFIYIEIPFKISAQNIKSDFQNTKCRPILGQFWPKMANFEFSQKNSKRYFSTL